MKIAAIIIELTGIAMIICGIIIEVKFQAHEGLIAITVGSLLIAIGGIIWAKIIPWHKNQT